MPIGSIFSKAKNVTFYTADNKKIRLKESFISKFGLKIFGIPHIGLRIRAHNILKTLPKQKHLKILDAGCGPGTYSLTLAKEGHTISGFDINKKKIAQSQNINKQLGMNVNFSVKSIYDLGGYPKNYFDVIICSDVLEHLKKDFKALEQLYKVLKKGGCLIVTVPADTYLNRKYLKIFEHERLYTKELLKNIFTKNNFSIIYIGDYLRTFGKLSWRINRAFFFSKILTAFSFYPLLILALVDNVLPIGKGEGLIAKLEK